MEQGFASKKVPMPYAVRESRAVLDGSFVLLDPDDYLRDASYVRARREGTPALQNLWFLDSEGRKLWEAEMPEDNDYYYQITCLAPLMAQSFSGYSCEIDTSDGRIVRKTFHK